jgi:hypothetical protein
MKACLSAILAIGVLLAAFASPGEAHARSHHQLHGHSHHQRFVAIHDTHSRARHEHRHFARGYSSGHHVHVARSSWHRGPAAVATRSGGASESRGCLTGQTRALLDRVEAQFGRVEIVSTCRPGAVIAGTGHASMHRYGRAVDFVAPGGRKAEIVRWLAANNPGGTMTYAHMNHIHMDTGSYHFVSLGSPGAGGGWHRHHAHVLAHGQTTGSVHAFRHGWHGHIYAHGRGFGHRTVGYAHGYGEQPAWRHAGWRSDHRY